MHIHALHTNGYMYTYRSAVEEDVKQWFVDRDANLITVAYVMDRNPVQDRATVGKKVSVDYVDGAFTIALKFHNAGLFINN